MNYHLCPYCKEMIKYCRKCKEYKSCMDFHHNKRQADGYQTYCKPCTAIINKKWKYNHRESIKAYHKAYIERKRDITELQYYDDLTDMKS